MPHVNSSAPVELAGTMRMALLLALCAAAPLPAQAPPRVRFEVAVTGTGEASALWLAMLQRRLPAARYDSVARLRRVLGPGDRAWADLLRSRGAAWEAEIPALAALFAPVTPPAEAVVVIGNRGGEDAFVYDSLTIGFDVAALGRVYGPAGSVENRARVDRLFRHEYVHLLQRRWLARHPYSDNTPLRAAIAEIWAEGLGVWYSMSDRWRMGDGQHSAAAGAALRRLEPVFVARLEALRCATEADARALTADLSFGPFERKWGALPPALWLEAEQADSPDALRRFVVQGPQAVWGLAGRRLPAELSRRLLAVPDSPCPEVRR